ncbi:hypothetical protein [Actinomadura livida]|uniref:Uncharacterized protein n=1 Tax=Actinomadura livida TaxID=79909 RepID=A0A7W7MV88_9ACTN|nr:MULTISPECIES: hypothetical protein [Actinomadura]MBB4771620.1 hypothetical protein [Actinomadura catellatispora]GGU01433.1 hypothetical protein GCM10010208_26420 [Actinomadura livida]
MSDHNGAGDLDRRTAERVLGGADDHARLHALLAAAAAPARPEELAGEDAAVTAFKAVPRPARTSRMAALRRFLTVKALVLVGGSLILTGGAAAYAAMNGHIPGRAPDPSATPTFDQRRSTGQHSEPVTHVTPRSEEPATAPSSAPPATKKRRSASPGPAADPSAGSGRENAPGQQTPPPGNPDPPRGPGDDNGSPSGENSGNGQENGNNGNNGSPPGQNSGNGQSP